MAEAEAAPAGMVDQYLNQWLAHVRGRVRARTWQGYEGVIRLDALPSLASLELASVGPLDLQHLYADLLAREVRPLSAGTILNLHLVLHQAFGQAVRWGMITSNPVDGAQPPRPRRPEPRVDADQHGACGLPLSADLLSIGVVMLAIGAGAPLADGHGIVGAIVVQAVSILDGVDGEVARRRLRTSARGAMLDGVLDRVADAAIIGGMGIWALATVSAELAIWLTVVALAGSLLSMASKDRAKLLHLPDAPETRIGWLLGGRDGRLLLIAISAASGLPALGLGLTAGTSLLSLGIRPAYVMRRQRD